MPENKEPQRRIDANHRLILAFAIGLIVYFSFRHLLAGTELYLLTWICFGMSLIISQWVIILTRHPRGLVEVAKLQDSSRSLIFLFVIFASMASVGAIFFLLKSPKGASEEQITAHVLLSFGAVIVSWWLVHTVFTLKYAHEYYDTTTDDGEVKSTGGLDFPGDNTNPDYLDFVYFSFVIGMTFQVSDVTISSRYLRRLVLLHALIAFAFNTAIVALSINVISGLVAH